MRDCSRVTLTLDCSLKAPIFIDQSCCFTSHSKVCSMYTTEHKYLLGPVKYFEILREFCFNPLKNFALSMKILKLLKNLKSKKEYIQYIKTKCSKFTYLRRYKVLLGTRLTINGQT